MASVSQADLDLALSLVPESEWKLLQGSRIFITGGTGFFGKWLLETLCEARRRYSLECEALILTRSPSRIIHELPHLNHESSWLNFHVGDVTDFKFPSGQFEWVIHAATPASAEMIEKHPREMFETIVVGTRRVLEFASHAGCKRFLLTSSGAVYGRQPSDLERVPETYLGAPDPLDPRSVYGEGKRAAEMLCALEAKRSGLEPLITRSFAFVGPHLPLDLHFAVGNFISDVLRGRPIRIAGDGTPFRSYLYAAELAGWLWKILLRGHPGRAYNVGSPNAISIADLARVVAKRSGKEVSVETAHSSVPGRAAERYVPSVDRASAELGLKPILSLEESIDRTLAWAKEKLK